MNVYVLMFHNKANYPYENSIESIHLTQDLANKALLSWKESQANNSRKNEYWIEDYTLDLGDLTVQESKDHIIIYTK